jgi:hypothetical protein
MNAKMKMTIDEINLLISDANDAIYCANEQIEEAEQRIWRVEDAIANWNNDPDNEDCQLEFEGYDTDTIDEIFPVEDPREDQGIPSEDQERGRG